MPRQQVRIQQRKIKPKVAQMEPPKPARGRNRALQARMLEGHSPATVVRLTTYLAAYQAAMLLLCILLAVFLFSDWPLKVLDVIFFLAAILVPGTLIWPALVLALRDRRATPELIQGQVQQASPVSLVYGLGMLYVNTRQRQVQLNVERKLLRTVPQNQVQVALRITPNLRHVQSVQVIGPRLGGGMPTDVPDRFKRAERFPLYALGGAYGLVFGLGLLLLLAPLYGALLWLHVLLVPLGMALAAVAARFGTSRFQKRLEASLQA